MGTRLDWKIFWLKKKIIYGPGVRKVSKSNFASVRLKAYLIDIFQIRQFLFVKTPMGLQLYIWFWGRKKKFSFSWAGRVPIEKTASVRLKAFV